jgi:malonyl-CoA decarboxylase
VSENQDRSLTTPAGGEPGLIDRAVSNLRDLWRGIAGSDTPSHVAGSLSDSDIKRLRAQMLACLDVKGGEVSARSQAAALGHEYLGLSEEGQRTFLELLAVEFGPDAEELATAAGDFLAATSDAGKYEAEEVLRGALEAPRVRLLTQFNALPDGVKFLVDMRAKLLAFAATDPRFAGLLADLKDILRRWFDIGFLELRRITWEAPANLLEKLIAYEAVHEISSWDDLKNRLAPDRRCFAYSHPGMPDEPLIFVEVALTNGMADNVATLLDTDAPLGDPEQADAAIFYSISNAQVGLHGISFGGFLIKRVVDVLAQEFPALKTFATLSPVPGFMRWYKQQKTEGLLTPAEQKSLVGNSVAGAHPIDLLADGNWYIDDNDAPLRTPLQRALARYLVHAKRHSGAALDSVANFHLSNGARLERINWLADVSKKGMGQSAGMMVNYLYRRDDIEANHEAYRGEGKVTTGSAVRGLAKKT